MKNSNILSYNNLSKISPAIGSNDIVGSFCNICLGCQIYSALAPSPIIWPPALIFYRLSQHFFKIKAGYLIYFPIASLNTEALKIGSMPIEKFRSLLPIFLNLMLGCSCRQHFHFYSFFLLFAVFLKQLFRSVLQNFANVIRKHLHWCSS